MAARRRERTGIWSRCSAPRVRCECPTSVERSREHRRTKSPPAGGWTSVHLSLPLLAHTPLSARWVRFEFRTDVSAPVSACQRSSTNVSEIGSHERAFGKTGHFRTFSDLGVHRDSITCNNPIGGFHIPCPPRDLPFAIFPAVARRCILLHAAPAISKCSPAVAPAAHTLHTIPPRTFPPKSAGDIQGIPAAALTNASSP